MICLSLSVSQRVGGWSFSSRYNLSSSAYKLNIMWLTKQGQGSAANKRIMQFVKWKTTKSFDDDYCDCMKTFLCRFLLLFSPSPPPGTPPYRIYVIVIDDDDGDWYLPHSLSLLLYVTCNTKEHANSNILILSLLHEDWPAV